MHITLNAGFEKMGENNVKKNTMVWDYLSEFLLIPFIYTQINKDNASDKFYDKFSQLKT